MVLPLAATAWVLRLVASGLAGLAGAELPEVWALVATGLGADADLVRLVLFGGIHVGLAVALLPRLVALSRTKGWAALRRRAARIRVPDRARRPLEIAGWTGVTLVGVAFLLQPTLVPLRVDGRSWLERAANLADGTASAHLVDSVVGLARALRSPPVEPGAPVRPEDFDRGLHDEVVPLMDRWDEALLAAVEGDRELFARTKAFLWVESGGRQFALSSTGCAGLMQFCASTASDKPFRSIFGVGRVAACGCRGCAVPREVQVALETDPEAVERVGATFPCDLSDARFDPDRSLRAGVAYVKLLGERFGGHLPLMYVGYNSGPGVAAALHRKLAAEPRIGVAELRPHLADALRPYYGARAEGRASGLLEVHLPKLVEAYERWRRAP